MQQPPGTDEFMIEVAAEYLEVGILPECRSVVVPQFRSRHGVRRDMKDKIPDTFVTFGHELKDVVVAAITKVGAAAHVQITDIGGKVAHDGGRLYSVETGAVTGLHDGRL